MNIARLTAPILGALALSATSAHGQAILSFSDIKNFQMVGPNESVFQGGALQVTLVDGSFQLLPCLQEDDSGALIASGAFETFQAPNIFCPSGTTGLLSVTAFDFNNDGVRDNGLFVSVTQPLPAINVEPFQTALVSLFSAPPSDLPRPLGGFPWVDMSQVVFYDLVNDPRNGRGFEITNYVSTRPYNAFELERQRDEIVPGSYIFTFPALGSSAEIPRDFAMTIPLREMVEAVPGPGGRSVTSAGISVGNDFRLTNDERWSNGAQEFDPRVVSDFVWEGINGQTFLADDRLFFAIRDRSTNAIVFPPFPAGQAASSQLIAGGGLPLVSGFELGPNFFGPGANLTAELEFRRNNQVGNTIDSSVRFFRWDINLVDTFAGFQTLTFPAGSNDDVVLPEADFDGDGFTNLEEFGLQTDPLDPASVPDPTPLLDPFTGHCDLTIQKRPAVGSRLIYTIEYTTDFDVWITIDDTDPNFFIVTDNEDEISVFSRVPVVDFPCFTRVRLTLN